VLCAQEVGERFVDRVVRPSHGTGGTPVTRSLAAAHREPGYSSTMGHPGFLTTRSVATLRS
jgi:hypothetical protein